MRHNYSCLCLFVYFSVFQFSYTAVFGAYTAFIFIRTGASIIYNTTDACTTPQENKKILK